MFDIEEKYVNEKKKRFLWYIFCCALSNKHRTDFCVKIFQLNALTTSTVCSDVLLLLFIWWVSGSHFDSRVKVDQVQSHTLYLHAAASVENVKICTSEAKTLMCSFIPWSFFVKLYSYHRECTSMLSVTGQTAFV